VDAVKALGGEARLVGDSYTETQAHAWAAAEKEQRSFIAPYDDPLTIAGQGTIGAEILKQLGQDVENLHAIFVPIGGGGLIAGVATYVKALRPEVKMIGVEPTGANCMAQSLQAGRRVTLSKVDAFADGVAVKSVGAVRHLQRCTCMYMDAHVLCQKYVDGVVLVDNAAISAAIKDMFTETRTVLEPAGALAMAGAKAYLSRTGDTV
jgi:threonine dehydratase